MKTIAFVALAALAFQLTACASAPAQPDSSCTFGGGVYDLCGGE